MLSPEINMIKVHAFMINLHAFIKFRIIRIFIFSTCVPEFHILIFYARSASKTNIFDKRF